MDTLTSKHDSDDNMYKYEHQLIKKHHKFSTLAHLAEVKIST